MTLNKKEDVKLIIIFNKVEVYFGKQFKCYNSRFNFFIEVGQCDLDVTLLELFEMRIISQGVEFFDLQHRPPISYIVHWNTKCHHKITLMFLVSISLYVV